MLSHDGLDQEPVPHSRGRGGGNDGRFHRDREAAAGRPDIDMAGAERG